MGVSVKPTELTVTMRCRVAVCGDSAVGKTALLTMFASKGQKYPRDYLMTSNVNVVVGSVHIPDTTALVELYLYDTSGSALSLIAGTDASKDALSAYWNNIYYAMLVYDVTSAESFDACKHWLEELKRARPDKDRPLKAVLVATKSDLPTQQHRVQDDVAVVWAKANGLDFFSVSAVPPGKDVEAPFLCLAKAFHKSYEEAVTTFQDACRNY